MLALFKLKNNLEKPYDSIARDSFSRTNKFVDCMRDLVLYSFSEEMYLIFIEELEEDVDLYKNIRINEETFTLSYKTKDYFECLLKTINLINKCSKIIHSNSIKEADYLINELVDVVYLLQELDRTLRKGVPIDHKTVMDAVFTIHQLLNEKLNEYYQLNSESLSREIEIAKQLRKEYQDRKKTFNINVDTAININKCNRQVKTYSFCSFEMNTFA